MSIKISGIYIILNIDTQKAYIGQSNNVKYRWRKHKYELKSNIHFNSYLQNAYNKYGIDSFEFKILEECDQDIIDEREQYYIDLYKSLNRNFGYNLDSGGNHNKKHSKETIEKISRSNLGKKRSLETRERNRQANLGKKLTEEHKRKLSENNGKSMLSKKFTEETKRKMSESKIKYTITEEMENDIINGITRKDFNVKYNTAEPYRTYRKNNKDKIFPSNHGCSMRGKFHKEESKQKISDSKMKYKLDENMISDIENGMTRNKFKIKYGSEQPWRRYRHLQQP